MVPARDASHIIKVNNTCFKVPFFSQDAEGFNAVHHVHSMVLELQAKHEKLVQTIAELVNEYNRREKTLEELYGSIDRLEQNKADKKHVTQEIGIKVRFTSTLFTLPILTCLPNTNQLSKEQNAQ